MKRKRVWILPLLSVLSIIISLALVEFRLRLINYPYQDCKSLNGVSEFYLGKFDPDLGWSYIANSSTNQDGIFYNFNQESYRVENIDQKTNFKKPIILVIGDSILFGHKVNFNESFGYKLQKELGDKYEVINFSVQGYGTDQIYLMMQKQIPKYKPVAVITDYISDHNKRNVNQDRRYAFPCQLFSGTKPYFKINNGKLELANKAFLYRDFDKWKINLAIKRLEETFRFKDQKYQTVLTKKITEDMYQYAKEHNTKLFTINYDTKLTAYQKEESQLEQNTIEIDNSALGKNYYEEDTFHPNKDGVTVMVNKFLERFGKSLTQN